MLRGTSCSFDLHLRHAEQAALMMPLRCLVPFCGLVSTILDGSSGVADRCLGPSLTLDHSHLLEEAMFLEG
jgi:hypothetical protein